MEEVVKHMSNIDIAEDINVIQLCTQNSQTDGKL
jgi:hypothetical protein